MKSGQLQKMRREAFDRLVEEVEAGKSERPVSKLLVGQYVVDSNA